MRRAVAGGIVAIGASAVVGVAAVNGVLPVGAATGSPDPGASSAPRRTATVERETLRSTREVDGTLGYGGAYTASGSLPGTLTWLAPVGSVVERGGRLAEVDGISRTYLLIGDRPAWRTLDEDVTNGADVQQLEENLVELGFAPDGMTVDRNWDSDTTEAVEAWQDAAGLPVDGSLELGEVAFLPTAFRVTEHLARLGTPGGPGSPLLAGSSTNRIVTVDLAASDQDLVAVNDAVEIELPDGTIASATVTGIGRVATAGDPQFGEEPTVEVTVTPDDPDATGSLDQAPVTVHVVGEVRENVLTVPVNALLALLEGGYAVEVVESDGSSHLVGVDIGMFESGHVEISGDGIDDGTVVEVPS